MTDRWSHEQAPVGSGSGGDDDTGAVGAGPSDPTARVAWQLVRQAQSCAAMGSPLSAFLLDRAAVDVLEGGPCAELLLRDVRPGRGDAAALRFLAALHRLVLERRSPALALHYPSVGGTPDLTTVGATMVDTVATRLDELVPLVAQPCQTNEVGRSAGLVVGLLDVAAVTGLPLRLREIGSSAGLNLRLDHFRYELPASDTDALPSSDTDALPSSDTDALPGSDTGGTRLLGDPDAELVLRDRYRAPLPGNPTQLPAVVDRRGCDVHPIDPTTPDGRARVSSSIWADQVARFERLGAALRTAQRVPATVDRATAAAWLREQLRTPAPGTCTVVMHSVVWEYLPHRERVGVEAALAAAGARARPDAPIAHVTLEPVSDLRQHGVSVRVWPHLPAPRLLATCGAHGTDVTPA